MGKLIFIILAIITIPAAIWVCIIKATCNYLAKRNAQEFNYDRLATRTAEEICKRIMIIERQKKMAYKDATSAAEDRLEKPRQNTD